ncbi:hypothetical protein ONZ45_g6355 [Pleurotus djamor]|nr:hypothetical protein ONZ45_g6355 [Pleurotus djamor]
MGKSNPSANPLSNPASKPLSGVKKVASEAGSTDAGEMTASHRSDRNEMDQECGANENGVLVKSLSKPPRSSSAAATITATTRGKSENEKTPAPTRQRLHSTTLASSPSSTSSPTLSKSKTSDSKESHTMVRSAIGRSQSASATTTTTTTIGPRPPSSHKLPAPVSSSSWCTPPKDRIKRHTSVEASSQRPSTAAPSSSSSYKKFPSLSSTLEKSSDSLIFIRCHDHDDFPNGHTLPTCTRSKWDSHANTTFFNTLHLILPTTLSLTFTSKLSRTPFTPLLFPTWKLNDVLIWVAAVIVSKIPPLKYRVGGFSAYGSGSESEAIKGVGGGTFHKMQHGSDSEGGYKSAPGAIGDGRHGSGKGELKGRQRWLAEMQKALKVDEDEKQRQEIPQLPSLRLVQSLDTPPSSPPPPLGTSASSAGDSSKFPLTPITVLTTKSKGMSLSELEKVNEKEKRIRNVLKKRPSTGGFSFLRRPGTPSSGKAASSNAQSPIMQSPLPMSPNMLHSPQLHPKSRSPSRNHGKEGSGSSGSPSASNLPPRSLTPAAQLAMAYREQEARRDDLAGSALGHYASPSRSGSRSGNTSASASVISIAAGVMSGPASTSHGKDMDSGRNTNDDGGEPGTPYYTVFGSTTGKVVAVGSPYDAWGQDVDVPWSRGREKSINAGCGGRRGRSLDGRGKEKEKDGKNGKNGSGPMSGVGKTLSRKISGRFRKGSEVTVDTEVKLEVGELGELGHARDKGWSFGKSQQRRSLRLSIDKFAFTEDIPVPPKPPLKQQSPPPTNEPPPAEETKKKNDPSVLNSGKIWKLMKRISSGALRDRYAEPPPPVPALPKGFSAHPTSTSPQTAQEPKPEGLSRFLSRQSNQSVPCADPPLKKHATAVAKLSATGAVVSAAPRHSLNTSSSSPISDELHSLRFFKGTHSSRSSRSSLFDDVDAPPLPVNSMIAQHIIPPSEFNRGDTSEESVGHEKEVVTLQSKKPSFLYRSPITHTPN